LLTNDNTISRIHFQIDYSNSNKGPQLFIKDLKSTNRTYINDNKEEVSSTEEVSLVNGDTLIIGESNLEYL